MNSTIRRHNDVKLRHFSVTLCPDFGNDKYVILCNFSGRIMSGFEVKEEGTPDEASSPSKEAKKKARSEEKQ